MIDINKDDMSQNKTVFPGMNPEGYQKRPNFQNPMQGQAQNPSNPRGTVFPGMGSMGNNAAGPSGMPNTQNSKPVIGFLYSVSRTPFGEFWPLHIGPNSIGKDPSCDICLPEATVSSQHAEIVIRKMKNPEKVEASVSDARSTNGSMLNGVSLSSTGSFECKNGDILTIGESYELLIILIDAKLIGLEPSQNFIEIEEYQEEQPMPHFNPTMGGFTPPPMPPHFTPNGGAPSSNNGGNTSGGTVGMNDNMGGPMRGGTEWQ